MIKQYEVILQLVKCNFIYGRKYCWYATITKVHNSFIWFSFLKYIFFLNNQKRSDIIYILINLFKSIIIKKMYH